MMGPPGTTDSGIGSVIESREARALHSILVKNLEPATRYPFTVRVSGAQRYGAITTAPAEDSGTTFRFLIYGDTAPTTPRTHPSCARWRSPARLRRLHRRLRRERRHRRRSGRRSSTSRRRSRASVRIFATVGNHELTDGRRRHVRYFGPRAAEGVVAPARHRCRRRRHGDARSAERQLSLVERALLPGQRHGPYTSGAMRAWLDKVLTDSDDEPGLVWRIVVVHHGPWSSGPHGDNRSCTKRTSRRLLRAHKVDLVISGHDHIYERGFADGPRVPRLGRRRRTGLSREEGASRRRGATSRSVTSSRRR